MFDIFEITKKIKKLFTPVDIAIFGGIIVLFLVTRIVNLDRFPIFCDEGIYIHWSKTAWHDGTQRFISMIDGRQPLHTWGMIPFMKLFPSNLLFAGRLFSIFTGLVSLFGMIATGYYLLGKKSGYLAGLIYILTPGFLFYDRMALIDSGVTAGFIWILLLSIILIKNRRLDLALIFGLVAGMFLLTKSSTKLFLLLSLFAPILILTKDRKQFVKNSINYYLLFAVIGILCFALYNVQRLSPNLFHYVSQKNNTFILTFSQWKENPFAYFNHNFYLIPYYVMVESGFIIVLSAIVGGFYLYKKDWKLLSYLSIWILVSYFVIAFLAIVLYPRYVMFLTIPLIILSLYYLKYFKCKCKYIIVILYLLVVGYFNYTILFDYKNIPFPPIDRGQYITGETAGWGVKDIVDYARSQSQNKPVVLMAEGTFGVVGDMLEVFINPEDRIYVEGYWPLKKLDLIKNQPRLIDSNIYIVFAQTQKFPSDWPMILVRKYPKPDSDKAYYLYRLLDR